MKNIIIILCVLYLNSCAMGSKTYEVLKRNLDSAIGVSSFKEYSSKWWVKKNYDNDSYIYIYIYHKGDNVVISDSRCIFGYITNKDDPNQVVTGWTIISGKEYCKERKRYACCI